MGIIPRFALCEDICMIAERFFEQIQGHPIVKYIVSGLLFVNYYAHNAYHTANIYTRDLYYKYIDLNYEELSIAKSEKYGTNIDTMNYSNFKTDQHIMLKSNTLTFTEHYLQNAITKELLQTMVQYKNPLLSAILSIKDKVNDVEYSLEVNNILKPFMFPGNTINGNRGFLMYLIHTYYNRIDSCKNKATKCIALENFDSLNNFSVSLTYITLDDAGLTTIPELCDTEWKLLVTEENKIKLEIE